jgi:FHS family L-fucose permease-like MFS transporter
MQDSSVDVASRDIPVVPRKYLVPFVLITTLFALWGVANNMTDIQLATFKKVMSMTDTQTSLIQVAFYGAYFCLALPAAIFIRRSSYKAGVLLGLAMYATGAAMCYPASQTLEYWHFLAAFYIFAGGCAVLETAANPYILVMGPAESATERLNLAQSFNPLGSIIGIFLGKYLILAHLNRADAAARSAMGTEELETIQHQELATVATTYGLVGLVGLVIWLLIAFNKFPYAKGEEIKDSIATTFGRLMRQRHWVWGVTAQFFYVGAQICVWSFTIRYVMVNLGLNEDDASTYYLAGIIVFSISRFICTALMKVIAPHTLLWVLALVAAGLTGIVAMSSGFVGVYALIGISACMSLMFPTIYGLALHGLSDDDTKVGASGLIMAILGGAILTYVQGSVSDHYQNINLSYIVPLICFIVIAYYGMRGYKADAPQTA